MTNENDDLPTILKIYMKSPFSFTLWILSILVFLYVLLFELGTGYNDFSNKIIGGMIATTLGLGGFIVYKK